jgi:hypothetical protein
MSWGFKTLETLCQPSVTAFVTIDPYHDGLLRPTELRDYHGAAEDLSLPDSVPQTVRDYFDATRMLWTHGWFYYPFFSLAALHAGLSVELALTESVRQRGIHLSSQERKFGCLLDRAIREGWISPTGFSLLRRRKEIDETSEEMAGEPADEEFGFKQDQAGEARRLADSMQKLVTGIRKARNRRAHPVALSVNLPGRAYAELEFARDFIVQIFAATR